MKILFFTLSLLLSIPSLAEDSSLITCTSESSEEIKSDYVQIKVNKIKSKLDFQLHELSFSFNFSDIESSQNSYQIINKTTLVSSNGKNFEAVVDGIITLSEDLKHLEVDLSIDDDKKDIDTLKCRIVTILIEIGF